MIDLLSARALLKAAVDTQGRDFVYNTTGTTGEGCFNVPRDADENEDEIGEDDPRRKTGCLVGTALSLAKIPDLDKDLSDMWASSVWAFARHMTGEANNYFSAAQRRQDMGSTWGEAYDEAEAYAEKVLADVEA